MRFNRDNLDPWGMVAGILLVSSTLLSYGSVPLVVVVISASLGLVSLLLATTTRTVWASYLASISGAVLLAIYASSITATIVLLVVTVLPVIDVSYVAPTLRLDARKLLPVVLIFILSLTYTVALVYALTSSRLEAFRALGGSGAGLAIIYGFIALLASSITYSYYSSNTLTPSEVLDARRLYSTLTPETGFKLSLYLASILPAITLQSPGYVVATLIAFLAKTLIPSRGVRSLDILVYAATYFIITRIVV